VKLFDTLLGRTKPVKANLDALFSLPSAAITLQVSAGYVPTGKAGVCFKPPAGQPFAEVQAEIEQLLRIPDDGTSSAKNAQVHVNDVADSFGYRWILVEGDGIDDLVTRIHVVHSSLEDAGWSTQILCSVFAFEHSTASGTGEVAMALGPGQDPTAAPAPTIDKSSPVVYLVYLAKRGTFYPFAPTGKERRDNELELSLKSTIGSDLPIEEDLSRWFPLWDLPLA
jgi:hypothetical protein